MKAEDLIKLSTFISVELIYNLFNVRIIQMGCATFAYRVFGNDLLDDEREIFGNLLKNCHFEERLVFFLILLI